MKQVAAVLSIMCLILVVGYAINPSFFVSSKPKVVVVPAVIPAKTADQIMAEDTAQSKVFCVEFQKAMKSHPLLFPLAQHKINTILNGPDTPQKAAVMRTMERHVRAHLMEKHLVAGNAEVIDWTKIDWAKLLTLILQIVIALLPFLLML